MHYKVFSYLSSFKNSVYLTLLSVFFIFSLYILTAHKTFTQTSKKINSSDVLVADDSGGTDNRGLLLAVDPATGKRTAISDFGDTAQGPVGEDPSDVIINSEGDIYVIDRSGKLFAVDTGTGSRSVASDFGDSSQGTVGVSPSDLVFDSSGNVLVIDGGAGTGGSGLLFSVNAASGSRTVVSDFGDTDKGPVGSNPRGAAVDGAGNIYVVDNEAGTRGRGVLLKINPVTGNREILSDFGDFTKGPLGADPVDIT